MHAGAPRVSAELPETRERFEGLVPPVVTAPCFAIRRGNRLFELGLSEIALAFTAASSRSDQTAIAKVLSACGPDGFAAGWLRAKGLDWCATHIT